MTSLLLFNNFYLVISYRRGQKKKEATNYRIPFGHSLWSANQLPAQGVKKKKGFESPPCTNSYFATNRVEKFITFINFRQVHNLLIFVSYTYINGRGNLQRFK